MIFSETQRFRQPWLWALLGLIWSATTGIFCYGFFRQIVRHHPFGSSPMSDTGLTVTSILTFILLTAILALFRSARLTTRIDKQGIHYRFFPFHRKERLISRENISDVRIVSYHPMRQFGGWGIRYVKHGVAFIVSGKMGMEITLIGGKRIIIGTKKPEVLKAALKKSDKIKYR